MPPITAQCAAVCRAADHQHGLITRAQLRDLDITDSQIHEWQTTGFLRRVERTVFTVARQQLPWKSRLLSVCLATGGMASHRSGIALHQVAGRGGGRPEVSVPYDQAFPRTDAIVHRSTDLDLIMPVVIDGIPTTPVARTVLDVGAVAPFVVEGAARDAVGRRLTTWPELLSTLVTHSRRGRRGCGPLRAVLDEHYGDRTESQLERRFLTLIRAAGIPEPESQVEIHDDHGFVMRVDFGYPLVRLGIEVDSVAHHATLAAFEEDRIKRNRALLAGWHILAVTSQRIRRRPTLVCEEIATALRTLPRPGRPSEL